MLFVAIGTVLRLDPALAAEAIREVIEKNDAKTWATHHINEAGKIARRWTATPGVGHMPELVYYTF